MSRAASGGSPARYAEAEVSFSIGDVLARLRGEFPDITISKIRFLESEGLIEPHRAPSGYRKFGYADIERLRFVLSAQRDHYLPLRVIKDHLNALDAGQESPIGGVRRISVVSSVGADAGAAGDAAEGWDERAAGGRGVDGETAAGLLDSAGVVAAAGIDEELMVQLVSYGLIAPRPGRELYGPEVVAVAAVAGVLAAHGLTPRHLRVVKTAVEREVDLIDQAVAPLRAQRGPQAAARAEETGRELAAGLGKLHTLLVRTAISGAGGP